MHQLDIHIPDTTRTTSFVIEDTSSYDSSLKVEDGWLEVYAPSSTQPFLWKVETGFSVIINSNLLNLTQGNLADLQDGTYYIRYSVKPHSQVTIQYPYFRNTSLYNQYLSRASMVLSDKCRTPNREYNKKVKQLNDVRDLLDASRYMAEETHDLDRANMMYLDAKVKLDKVC